MCWTYLCQEYIIHIMSYENRSLLIIENILFTIHIYLTAAHTVKRHCRAWFNEIFLPIQKFKFFENLFDTFINKVMKKMLNLRFSFLNQCFQIHCHSVFTFDNFKQNIVCIYIQIGMKLINEYSCKCLRSFNKYPKK